MKDLVEGEGGGQGGHQPYIQPAADAGGPYEGFREQDIAFDASDSRWDQYRYSASDIFCEWDFKDVGEPIQSGPGLFVTTHKYEVGDPDVTDATFTMTDPRGIQSVDTFTVDLTDQPAPPFRLWQAAADTACASPTSDNCTAPAGTIWDGWVVNRANNGGWVEVDPGPPIISRLPYNSEAYKRVCAEDKVGRCRHIEATVEFRPSHFCDYKQEGTPLFPTDAQGHRCEGGTHLMWIRSNTHRDLTRTCGAGVNDCLRNYVGVELDQPHRRGMSSNGVFMLGNCGPYFNSNYRPQYCPGHLPCSDSSCAQQPLNPGRPWGLNDQGGTYAGLNLQPGDWLKLTFGVKLIEDENNDKIEVYVEYLSKGAAGGAAVALNPPHPRYTKLVVVPGGYSWVPIHIFGFGNFDKGAPFVPECITNDGCTQPYTASGIEIRGTPTLTDLTVYV